MIHTSDITLVNLSSTLCYHEINDIHLCEDPGRVNAIFRKGPRTTHGVRAGNMVPMGTMLVTPVSDSSKMLLKVVGMQRF